MKLSVSAYRAHASAHKKILSSSSYQTQFNYGSTAAASSSNPTSSALFSMDPPNPSAAGSASGGAILPTCATISSASSQMHPPPAFGAIGATSGHGATGSGSGGVAGDPGANLLSPTLLSPGTNTGTASIATSRDEEDDSSNQASSGSKGSGQR
uniref:Uncharacterized protein n=1 Tax=Anopheles atroparvus TaxID=41427 RepID=A0AAG5CYP3_ANOAO